MLQIHPTPNSPGHLLFKTNGVEAAELARHEKESAEMGDCEPCLVGGGTSSISGDVNICRFIVRSFVPALYSNLDAWGASQVDQWLDL